MQGVALLVEGDPVDGLLESLEDVLAGSPLFALATSGSDGSAHVNTAFFAHDEQMVLYFLSEPTTRHCVNLETQPRASAAVWLDPPAYGEGLRGVQLFGRAGRVGLLDLDRALNVYRGKFPSFAVDEAVRAQYLAGEAKSAFYRVDIDSLVLLDESRFGRREYIAATVSR